MSFGSLSSIQKSRNGAIKFTDTRLDLATTPRRLPSNAQTRLNLPSKNRHSSQLDTPLFQLRAFAASFGIPFVNEKCGHQACNHATPMKVYLVWGFSFWRMASNSTVVSSCFPVRANCKRPCSFRGQMRPSLLPKLNMSALHRASHRTNLTAGKLPFQLVYLSL